MKKRMCVWQTTILELRLNIHVSHCDNEESEFYLTPIQKEICKKCPHRVPVIGEDKLANSLADDVYIKLKERDDDMAEHLLNHCKKCNHWNKKDGMCGMMDCNCLIPIGDLLRNHDIQCPLGLW